jgi:hypothetical protein
MDYLTAEDSNDADKFTDFANSYMKRQNRPLFVRHEQTKIEAEAFAKSFSLFRQPRFPEYHGMWLNGFRARCVASSRNDNARNSEPPTASPRAQALS